MEVTAATTHFDAIVLGAGQAGPPLAVELANAGHKVALVERKDFGGTCVNTGCIPTKTLLANARVAHMARRAGDYGVVDRHACRRHEEGQGTQGRGIGILS
jgi:pyruvate/2-oxoglutarate dehydrogenase complex dihydrolipoamide dehydrogenase (E3) component